MENNKLKEWRLFNRYTWTKMAKEIGISYVGLNEIVRFGSPRTQVKTCMAIKKLTGLNPWDYLNDLDNLRLKK